MIQELINYDNTRNPLFFFKTNFLKILRVFDINDNEFIPLHEDQNKHSLAQFQYIDWNGQKKIFYS